MNIFLSYGHDHFSAIATRLKADLAAQNFDVWFDKDAIRGSHDWEIKIEEGITKSNWIIIVMTAHSVRRPDGVCLDEVSYARFSRKSIIPIMLQDVQPPLCISRIQYIDFTAAYNRETQTIIEPVYERNLTLVLEVLKGLRELNFEGAHTNLVNYLNPLDNDVYTQSVKNSYYGRDWLFKSFEEWLFSDNQVYILLGKAGTGKSRFIVELTNRYQEISAVHFCKYNDSDRSNPKRAIMSIAYYLATQINEYQQHLLSLNDLHNLEEKNLHRLFEYLIIEPFLKITHPERNYVINIDALDESSFNGKNELLKIISDDLRKAPKWLKFVITSRPEPEILLKLAKYDPLVIDANIAENNSDLALFYANELKLNDESIIKRLVLLSEDGFLYATEMVKEIKRGNVNLLNLDTFPQGLTGIYANYFDRLFLDVDRFDYKKEVRPILEVLVALKEPVQASFICEISGADSYEFSEIIEHIHALFPLRGEYIELLHKSLYDWLLDRAKSGKYYVNVEYGHRKIATYFKERPTPLLRNYKVEHFTEHALAAKMYEDAYRTLDDLSVQENRFALLSFDTAIQFYFREIETLNAYYPNDLLSRPTFITIFAHYRKLFFNYGLYFQTKDLGFNPRLIDSSDVEYLVSLLNYHYITEDYPAVLLLGEKIINEAEFAQNTGEISYLIGLSYRKLVDFKQAKHYISAVATSQSDEQEKASALLSLAQIALRELDFNEAHRLNAAGLEGLLQYLKMPLSDDLFASGELNLGEWYKLIAEALMWEGRFEEANRELENSEAVYKRLNRRDRYFVRCKYIRALLDVFRKNHEVNDEEYHSLLALAKSKYDQAQIIFIKGISDYFHNKTTPDLDHAFMLFNSINAPIEAEKIVLINLLQKKIDFTYTHQNPIIAGWINHLKKIILALH